MALIGTDEPRVSLYIDGSLVGSDTTFFNDLMVVDDKLEFGGSSRFSEDITGLMSDIAIWRGALSEGEIEALAAGAAVVPGLAFEITEIKYSPGDNMVTLTWDSREGASYAVTYSHDLQNWDADLDDGIDADAGDATTKSFDLTLAGLAGAGQVYFRVEEK
jgi:hypothetical protein